MAEMVNFLLSVFYHNKERKYYVVNLKANIEEMVTESQTLEKRWIFITQNTF